MVLFPSGFAFNLNEYNHGKNIKKIAKKMLLLILRSLRSYWEVNQNGISNIWGTLTLNLSTCNPFYYIFFLIKLLKTNQS